MTRIVLENAKIFDGINAPFTGSCSIEDDKIVSVGLADINVGPGDVSYDLEGRTLMPGLITAHLHPDTLFYGLSNFVAGEQLGKECPPGVLMAVGVRTCRVLLESGFTGYIGAACSHNIDVQLKMSIAQDIVPGPRIRPCGHHIGTTGDNNAGIKWWIEHPTPGLDLFADGVEGLRKLVRDEIRCGVEIIKIYASSGQGIPNRHGQRNMSRGEIAMVVEAAHERGVPVRAHVVTRDMIMECLQLGVDVIDHGNEIDEKCIELMQEAGAYWVPSLLYTKLALDKGADPTGEYGRTWNNVKSMIPRAQAAGIKILLGDDYGQSPGRRHDVGIYASEMSVYAEYCGVEPMDVLRWGTSNAGRLLGDGMDALGVVRSGALADLIVVDGDPTRNISLLQHPEQHLNAVIRNGAFFKNNLAPARARA